MRIAPAANPHGIANTGAVNGPSTRFPRRREGRLFRFEFQNGFRLQAPRGGDPGNGRTTGSSSVFPAEREPRGRLSASEKGWHHENLLVPLQICRDGVFFFQSSSSPFIKRKNRFRHAFPADARSGTILTAERKKKYGTSYTGPPRHTGYSSGSVRFLAAIGTGHAGRGGTAWIRRDPDSGF